MSYPSYHPTKDNSFELLMWMEINKSSINSKTSAEKNINEANMVKYMRIYCRKQE